VGAVKRLTEAALLEIFGSGYGDGDGSGYGDGNGDGSGYGSGYGSGSGSGYGSGYGDGYGDGDGSGYGDGDGYGSGDGSGYGSGYGDGDGDGSYWKAVLQKFSEKIGAAQTLSSLEALGARIAYWWSDANGLPCNGGARIAPAAPGVVHEVRGPLNLCHSNTLHATMLPGKWKGERLWIVALHGEVIGDDEKFGCLKREIIGECL